jgi:uracil-DNA glycosylase family 4
MLQKGKYCSGCPLSSLGYGFAGTGGAGTSTRVLVVAEALGGEEARAGVPLVGPAGKVWDRLITGIPASETGLGRNLQRDDFLLDNVIHCQPPGNVLSGAEYEHSAITNCRPYLEQSLAKFKPAAILTLGNTALRWFTGNWGIEQLRGYVFNTPHGPVIPTYHPSYVMRGKWNLARVVQMDVLKAIKVAREGAACLHVDKAYQLQPTYSEAKAFVDGWMAAGRPPLAFDIETPRDDEAAANEEMTFEETPSYQILMISLAWEPYKAISIPWIEPFIGLVKAAFRQPADFLVWNAPFDVPRLAANGVTFGGRVIDGMLAWHWLEPSLPMGLKWVAPLFCPDMGAWKLDMHQNFQWYNCADSDVLLRVFAETRKRLEAQGRWKVFERHFLDYGKILSRMTLRGVTVDHEARKTARDRLQVRFDETVDAARRLAPTEVCSLHPKRGYKRTPSDTVGMVRIQVELTEAEVAQRQKEKERAREKERKQAEKDQKRLARLQAKAARAAEKAERAARRKKL